MNIFKDRFSEIKKASEPLYKSPKSVQETIEILKISESGIFEVADGKYSKTYRFSDVNYATRSEEEQESFFQRYCRCLNSFDCTFKITVNNKNKDMDVLRNEVMLKYRNDGFDKMRESYNRIIEEKILEGRQGIEQERYLTITIERKNFEEAKAQFATIEASMFRSFAELGSKLTPLTGNERLKILHDYYRLGREDEFNFDIRQGRITGTDFRNEICNTRIKYHPDYFENEGKVGRVLFIKKYPTYLSDRFFTELTFLPVHSVTSVDVVPVPKDLTMKMLQKKYLGIESDIIKQQRTRNRNNDFSSDISYATRQKKKDIEEIMNNVRENDESLYYVSVTMIVMADDRDELESICETVDSISKGAGCAVDTCMYKQREAVNTTLPIGVRQIETMRTMLTQSLAVLMPFNVQELCDKNGIYYGVNQISKNIIVGNRKKLLNGNGFIFGVSGAGKSFQAKMEMGSVLLSTDDNVIAVDPMNEYEDVTEKYNGTYINISTNTRNYINPMDMDVWNLDVLDSKGWVRDKCQFMLSICEQIMKEITPQQRSIISRCVKDLYMDIARSREKYVPTMEDLYNRLLEQEDKEARDVALGLEIFVTGALNIFNHQTNINVNNRFIVYGIRDLGESLAPLAMLVMMETIQQKIIVNGERGIATWFYIDEVHVLLNSPFSAEYLRQMWKKVRKQGGLCTGITQNIVDLLMSETSTTMLSNSAFILLLNQSSKDIEKIVEALEISEEQLNYVIDSPSGCGLIKCGSRMVPFDNVITKDSELYRLYNTNMYEKMERLEKEKQ